MQLIKQEFSDRVEEIERYFHLLESAIEKEAQLIFPNENDRRQEFDFDLIGTLKSTVILLLYNLIESSISKCLEHIHQTISSETLLYKDVSDNIQKIWLEQFYEKFRETGNNNRNILESLKLMVDTLIQNNVTIKLFYGEKEKRNSETSGNLDARKVRELADKYGINFEKSSKSLQDIKDKRIKLAHGIESFSECCSSIVFLEHRDSESVNSSAPNDLCNLKKETIEFLEEFIASVESYVDNKKYKR